MKIAYICNYIGPQFIKEHCQNKSYTVSGIFKSTAIARALTLAGHQVFIYSPALTVCRKLISSFTEEIIYPEGSITVTYPSIVSYPKCSIFNSIALKNLLKGEIKKKEFDAVIFYNINITSALSLKYFKDKIRILEYEDNIFNQALKKEQGQRKPSRFKEFLYKYVLNKTDYAITVASGMLIHDEVKNKVLIPGAITNLVIDNINFRLKTLKKNSTVRLVLAGGTHYSKGADLLVKAIKFIKQPCEVFFYGAGNFDNETNEIIKSLPNQHMIIQGGFKPHSEMIRILSNESHILINTTRNMGVPLQSAGFPFKMMEYASTGRPIVSSSIGKLNNNFDKHITYYEDEDPQSIASAIEYVIDNYEMCAKNAKELQKYVLEEYSIEGLAKKLQYFIKQIENEN